MGNLQADVIVIGAGMAGASVAAELSQSLNVALVERESQPGVHATGRSAAAFIPSYGASKPALRILTRASRDFLLAPPAQFSEHSLLKRRGLLTLLGQTAPESVEAERRALNDLLEYPIERLSGDAIAARLPALRPEWLTNAWWEEDVHDIDVHGLHQGYLRQHKLNGGTLITNSDYELQRGDKQGWVVASATAQIEAPIVVNAAGAWADELAASAGVRRLGISPKRRTAILISPPEQYSVENWPLAFAHDESFYLKPDAGMLLVSPADEHPSAPCDAQPEEIDVAFAAHFAESALIGLQVQHIPHRWAGLRTFAPDRMPVIGFDTEHEGFFWCVGQGGHGVQIAPAVARLARSLITRSALPTELIDNGFCSDWVSPGRFNASPSHQFFASNQ